MKIDFINFGIADHGKNLIRRQTYDEFVALDKNTTANVIDT